MRLLRLLALLAVLLMPIEMAPAATAVHQASSASMPMQHCPEQGSSRTGFGTCMMACSAALPAAELSRPQPVIYVCLPAEARLMARLSGLHPDIATPPPKLI